MKYATIIARLLLGAIFLIFSLNFWLKFIPMPPLPEGPAGTFIGLLFASGYFAAIKVVELTGSLLVLSGRFTPVGLLFLGPIILNILFYDVFLAKAFNPISSLAAVLALFLLWAYRDRFAPLAKA
jgi:putative oxidoreductase